MKQITELEIIKYAELWLILEANILNSCCLCNLYNCRYFFLKNSRFFACIFVAPSQTSKACFMPSRSFCLKLQQTRNLWY